MLQLIITGAAQSNLEIASQLESLNLSSYTGQWESYFT